MRSTGEVSSHRINHFYFVFGLCGTLLASVILGFVLFGTIRTEAAPSEETYKYYTSVSIQAGDTIWSIAKSYRTAECGDLDDYIEEICSLNHISGDDIHAGQYLTVPYYSTECK